MKRFIQKIILLSIPPLLTFLLAVLSFVIIDPFMIVGKNRGNFNITNEYSITLNRDFQSTELLIKNIDNYNYNSFILGNSRSFFYNINSWKNYVRGNCFHFNSSNESLFGIERKLEFLKRKGVAIKNLLIILDYGTLSQTNNSSGHLFIKHPLISGGSYFNFYKEMFNGFFPKAFIAYVDLYITGKRKNYMEQYGIKDNVFKLDLKTNQLTYFKFDSIINNNIEDYYKDKGKIFYTRDSIQQYYPIVIKKRQKELLTDIKTIVSLNNADCKIIINPLYDQKKLNPNDLEYIENVFNKKNIFDFSGKNKFTVDYKNYYEDSHYRPKVAEEIMDIIYGKH